jgi:hypothetical protein
MVDLTLPGADQRLVDVFREEHVDTVFHAAFFTSPRRDAPDGRRAAGRSPP